jgi:hypothetical protein
MDIFSNIFSDSPMQGKGLKTIHPKNLLGTQNRAETKKKQRPTLPSFLAMAARGGSRRFLA